MPAEFARAFAGEARALHLVPRDEPRRSGGRAVRERQGGELTAPGGVNDGAIDEALAKRHYAEHEGKPFFNGLVEYITSAPVVAMVLEGTDAVKSARTTMGVTNPAEAAPGSIRGDFGLERGRNLVHGSDSPENGIRESELFFRPEEIVAWTRSSDSWIFE